MSGSSPERQGRFPRQLVRALARFYYPRMEITGRDRIPAAGPVLLVANHPNSLLDPPLLGIAARRPIHFLAKAPLFRIPFFGQIMHALGMLPAYRACDDPRQMKRNVGSLDKAADCLVEGRVVGIFPEGKSNDLPQVDQVKSGAARIALQAWSRGARELVIVPLGLIYQRKERFRTAVWIRVGAPIRLRHWLASAPEEERARVRALTGEIDRRLKSVSIHLHEGSWAPFLDDLEHLYPLNKLARVPPSLAALRHRKRLADAMNHFLEQDRPRAESLASAIADYIRDVKSQGLTVDSCVLRASGPRLIGLLLARTARLILGFGLALPGAAFHLAPFALARGLARLIQTNVRATHALARFGAGIPVYALWYAMASWILLEFLSPGWLAVLLGLMPVLGVMTLRYWYFAARVFPPLIHEWNLIFHPSRIQALKQQRNDLHLDELAEEYVSAASAI